MNFAEQNIARSFNLAEQLVGAKDIQEVMKLQAVFVQSQMELRTVIR
jgi:hypothetical protein